MAQGWRCTVGESEDARRPRPEVPAANKHPIDGSISLAIHGAHHVEIW